jgi:hypothetical protein
VSEPPFAAILLSGNGGRGDAARLAWSAHFNTAWARLEAKHGEDRLQLEHPQAPGADRPQICLLTREVLAEILRLPDGEAAQALRWMYREPDREGS